MNRNDYLALIRNLTPGAHIVPSPDSRFDGHDIACAEHDDSLFAAIEKIVSNKRGTIERMYANGFFCGYQITIPSLDEQIFLCTHSGSWGPWYHQSLYRRRSNGAWVFVERLGGHYSYSRAKATGLPFGRPRREARA